MSSAIAGLPADAESYLGRRLQLPDFRIVSAEQISGNGLSRNVLRVSATSAGARCSTDFVLLFEQPGSPVAPNRDAEFGILQALASRPDVPVPPAYLIEADPAALGAPFLLTGLLPGTTNPKKLQEPPLRRIASDIVTDSFTVLGRLAAVPVGDLGLGAGFTMVPPEQAWQTELARCEQTLVDCDCAEEVVTSAALRWLNRKPPPTPDRASVVHGDYRLGNYLFDTSGLTGIIDWEMVHIGDAMEDLAWSLLPLWEYGAVPGRPGGVLERQQAIAAWENGSGRSADPYALLWWTVFCHVKAITIWATARHMYRTNREVGVLPGVVGYALIQKQEAQLAEILRAQVP